MKYARNDNKKKMIIAIILLSILLVALIGFAICVEINRAEEPAPTKESDPTESTSQPTEGGSTVPEETDGKKESAPTEETDPTEPSSRPAEEETTDGTQPPVPTETNPEASEDAQKDLMVSTPYCNLYYPAEWKNSVRFEAESTAYGYIVSFYGTAGGREEELFVVFFAESSDNSFPIGTIIHENAMMDVSVELSDFVPDSSWEAADADDISAMQEGVNYLIDKLKENPVFTAVSQSSGSEPPEETKTVAQDLVIPTPYCDLYYPSQWKDTLRYEGRETDVGYIVVFYGTVNGKEAELFTIYFADTSEDSIPVGIYSADGVSMDVSMSMPDLPDDSGWSETEKEIFYGQQENVNYLIDKLRENPGFTLIEE